MPKYITKEVHKIPGSNKQLIRYGTLGEDLFIESLFRIADWTRKFGKENNENYEEACARRDAMPKKSAKVELTILGIAGIIFLIAVLCWLVPIFL